MKNPKPIKNRFSTLKLRHEDYPLPRDKVSYLQVSFDRVNGRTDYQTGYPSLHIAFSFTAGKKNRVLKTIINNWFML